LACDILLQGLAYCSSHAEIDLQAGGLQGIRGIGTKIPGYHRIHSRVGYHLSSLYSCTTAHHSGLVVKHFQLFGCGINHYKTSTATKAWINLGFEIGSGG
jgi:hypothetical protein